MASVGNWDFLGQTEEVFQKGFLLLLVDDRLDPLLGSQRVVVVEDTQPAKQAREVALKKRQLRCVVLDTNYIDSLFWRLSCSYTYWLHSLYRHLSICFVFLLRRDQIEYFPNAQIKQKYFPMYCRNHTARWKQAKDPRDTKKHPKHPK